MSAERDDLTDLVGLASNVETDHSEIDRAVDAILAAGYRKVETVWAETLTNDGAYEYTSSSDCDGSNVRHWRRKPSVQLEMVYSPWEAYSPDVTK